MITASTTATTARSWLAIWPNTAIASTGRCLHGGADPGDRGRRKDAAGSRLAGHLPGLHAGVAREGTTPPRRPSGAYEARRNGGITTGFGDGAFETPVTASGSPNSRHCAGGRRAAGRVRRSRVLDRVRPDAHGAPRGADVRRVVQGLPRIEQVRDIPRWVWDLFGTNGPHAVRAALGSPEHDARPDRERLGRQRPARAAAAPSPRWLVSTHGSR